MAWYMTSTAPGKGPLSYPSRYSTRSPWATHGDPNTQLIPTHTKARTNSKPHWTDTTTIPFLDGLRGLAALLVVAHHSGFLAGLDLGAKAVDAFFVLSAFLLTSSFEKKTRKLFQQQASLRQWRLALAEYCIRRFLRVYPLFAGVATVISLLTKGAQTWLFGSDHYYNRYNLVKTLLFFPDYRYHVFWTLPVEIAYYCIVPPLVVVVVKSAQLWPILVAAGYAVVVYAGLTADRSSHVEIWPHLPMLLCGSLAAVVYSKLDHCITQRQIEISIGLHQLLRTIQVTALVLLMVLCFDQHAAAATTQTVSCPRFVAIHISAVIVLELFVPGPVSSVLEWSLLRYAGKISYSMYLLHTWIVYCSAVTILPFYYRVGASWTFVLLVSTVSYRLVEQPCQRLARLISNALKEIEVASKA